MFEEVEAFKEQQINEIAKDLCSRYSICTCIDRDGNCSTPQQHAKIIYGLGYKKQIVGHWKHYSTTMMECSVCQRHVARHKYEYCPHCGATMVSHETSTVKEIYEQLTLSD